MRRADFDETVGTIIGDNYTGGAVYYDGRQQGNKLYADNVEELREWAIALVCELKREFCPIGLYTDNSKWELRIFN